MRPLLLSEEVLGSEMTPCLDRADVTAHIQHSCIIYTLISKAKALKVAVKLWSDLADIFCFAFSLFQPISDTPPTGHVYFLMHQACPRKLLIFKRQPHQ